MVLTTRVVGQEDPKEMFALFADLMFLCEVNNVFETHENCEFADVALQPNIIDFFGESLTVRIQVPF